MELRYFPARVSHPDAVFASRTVLRDGKLQPPRSCSCSIGPWTSTGGLNVPALSSLPVRARFLLLRPCTCIASTSPNRRSSICLFPRWVHLHREPGHAECSFRDTNS